MTGSLGLRLTRKPFLVHNFKTFYRFTHDERILHFQFPIMLKNAFRVTNVLKTLTRVRTSHDTLGKQTGMYRPNDAALCEGIVPILDAIRMERSAAVPSQRC